LKDGFATLNVASTFSQKKSGFETRSKGYNLVNLGFGGTVKLGKTVFDVNINGNNLFDKGYIAHLSRLKRMAFKHWKKHRFLG
jgi:iron complex outermembrane receptor protein